MAIEGRMNGPPPMSLSHEPTGTIVSLGEEAKKEFAIGDRIASLLFYNPCGTCDACTGPPEMTHRCQKMTGFIGCSVNGAMQQYLIVDSREVAKIPDSMSFIDAAPLTCAGATVWRALKVSKAAAGSWLAIVGSGGGLGHLLVAFAKLKGVKVIGMEAREQALELTRRAGADYTIDVRAPDHIEQVKRITGGPGVDATIVLADAQSATTSGLKVTKNDAHVVQIAQPDTITIPFWEVVIRNVSLLGSNLCSRSDFAEMLAFVAENQVHVETTVYRGLETLPKLVEDAYSGKIAGKQVLVVDPSQVE